MQISSSSSSTSQLSRAVWPFAILACSFLPGCQKSPAIAKKVPAAPTSPASKNTAHAINADKEQKKETPVAASNTESAEVKTKSSESGESNSAGSKDAKAETEVQDKGESATGTPAEKVTDASGSEESAGKAGDNKTAESGSSAATAEVKPDERFLVLTPGGPVIVDLIIQLQGSGYENALASLVEQAFKVADEDGDGKATWKDVGENPKFRSGQFGNLVADTDEERQQLVRMYDTDRDGLVDRDELPRFLTRNFNGARSFTLRSSNEYRTSNRSRSHTRILLDKNHDGAITAEEMDAAPGMLLNRDADDDEVVGLAEIKNSIDDMAAPAMMMSTRRRTNEPDTAIWLTNPSIDLAKRWGVVQFLLQELYSYGEAISESDWPLTADLYRQLDANSDGSLQRTELNKLLDVPAHLFVEVQFDGKSEKERGPRIKLRQLSSELAVWKPSVKELPTRLSLQLPDVELEFFVNEDASLSNVEQAAKAQFMALDRDKNGYLEKTEVPEQTPGMDATFESFDADSDGKVYEPEIVAYLDQRNAVVRAQVRARVADQEDALFTALDTDGDGRLNTREIRKSPERLREIDRNSDGRLQSHEIPGSMVVGFVRGNAQQDAQLFSAPASVAATVDASVPRWYRGMDANSDGEISRREFFGDQVQFDRIDTDHDGFILPQEAQKSVEGGGSRD
jgi:Ca2+-binding EF-hand superfamily protein